VPDTVEATDRPPQPRRRICFVRLAGICVVVCVLGLVFIQWWKPWLNTSERRLIGIWTWQDSPGEMTCDYREDGTMRYTVDPSTQRDSFTRWQIEGDVLMIEYAPRISLFYQFGKLILRRKFPADVCRIGFNPDGTVSFSMPDGSTKILSPWNRELVGPQQQAEE
jgi:hypothetical protein